MSNPFLGEIRMVGFNFAPRGWAMCNGQILAISQNTALFSLLGTTYGGDGQTTFALPDLRGRVPNHQGQGPGLSNYDQGQVGGVEAVTLLASQMPAHTHATRVSSAEETTNRAVSGVPAKGGVYGVADGDGPVSAASGGSQPHQILQPYLTINFVIALEGIFPSRN